MNPNLLTSKFQVKSHFNNVLFNFDEAQDVNIFLIKKNAYIRFLACANDIISIVFCYYSEFI
jgi:hypothetical protein